MNVLAKTYEKLVREFQELELLDRKVVVEAQLTALAASCSRSIIGWSMSWREWEMISFRVAPMLSWRSSFSSTEEKDTRVVGARLREGVFQ